MRRQMPSGSCVDKPEKRSHKNPRIIVAQVEGLGTKQKSIAKIIRKNCHKEPGSDDKAAGDLGGRSSADDYQLLVGLT
jgi:hypothetical protein